MTGLQVFQNNGWELRAIEKDGEPWFVASDVLKILGVDRTSLERLDDDEKGVDSIHTPGGKQTVTIISEPGLYSLVLGSRKPEAKPFKRWVTHEVIPSIRKTGSYSANPESWFGKVKAPKVMSGALVSAMEKVYGKATASRMDFLIGYVPPVTRPALTEPVILASTEEINDLAKFVEALPDKAARAAAGAARKVMTKGVAAMTQKLKNYHLNFEAQS